MIQHGDQAVALDANHDLFAVGLYRFDQTAVIDWRLKGRMRTVSVALVLCLNIGVDPPDQLRSDPAPILQCWIDPRSMPPVKALTMIGARLQQQYERWQPRARYVTSLDQTVDDLRKLCISVRRSSKGERILFHYNGHGVPRPTDNGEIWLFNKNYTQYVPLSIYELVSWLQSPTIYVFDCSNSGMIPAAFAAYEHQRPNPDTTSPNDTIVLAACSAGEYIPMNPDLGVADVFTSCLTTPIQMALRWFLFTTPPFLRQITFEQIDQIPGKPNDRKTPLGELNWIFTAVTDTIAWSSLPCAVFQRLFRQDLLVASQFRNYLLACRLMPGFGCHPVSQPPLPDTSQHCMWEQWDLIADWACIQTQRYLDDPDHFTFQTSSFFADQLTAFEIWLDLGLESKRPLQLPVVLQVLLSQTHRLRALQLLARFIDMGPWAVNQALSVGMFPYVLKLLQSPTHELRNVLVFIWAKIIALDQTCQRELIKDQYHLYFISAASSPATQPLQKSLALFVLAAIADNYHPGQMAILSANGYGLLLGVLSSSESETPFTRHMTLMCLGNMWRRSSTGRQYGLAFNDTYGSTAVDLVADIALSDAYPLTRTSALYAIVMFLSGHEGTSLHPDPHLTAVSVTTVKRLCRLQGDVCALVRQQLVHCIAALVQAQLDAFVQAQAQDPTDDQLHADRGYILDVIRSRCLDPAPSVCDLARKLSCFVSARSDQAPTSESQHDPGTDDLFVSALFQLSRDLVRRPSDQRSRAYSPDHELSYLSYDVSEPGRTTRQHRYDRIDDDAMKLVEAGDLSHCMALLTSPLDMTTQVKLHPYEPVLFAADRSRICLLNYSTMQASPIINNGNGPESEIRSLNLINARYDSLISAASNDGVIRIWSSMAPGDPCLRATFVAYPTMAPHQSDRLITDWQQDHLRLITASSRGPIKVWDLDHEVCACELDGARVRSLSTDGDSIVFTAHDDRQVRLSDLRLGQYGVGVLCVHEDDVVGVYAQHHTAFPFVVSCSERGCVQVNDLRMPHRLLQSFQGLQSGSKSDRWRAFAVSESGNLYAGASVKQSVNVGTLTGTALNTIRHYDGFLGQRIGHVQCLTFHERYPILALGCSDSHIPLFHEPNRSRYWFST